MPSRLKMDKKFNLQLPESTFQKLCAPLETSGRDGSFQVCLALEAYFEDVTDLRIANYRLHSNDTEVRINDVLLELARS